MAMKHETTRKIQKSINELETNYRNKNITDLYTGIKEFIKGY
jgi:hypothetical protein